MAVAKPAPAGHYDELLTPSGQLRTAWGEFFSCLGEPGLAELNLAEQRVRQRVEEDGVTYNVYGDSRSMPRRWSLDVLPFLINAEDWRIIEPALRQRAKVLAALMSDLYGPQIILKKGLLPPALVLGSPAYVRGMRGVLPLGGSPLQIIGFDLARGPDGRWWVLGQRTQAPSGLGYALENRIIIGRTFPRAFATLQVQRLAASYYQFLQALIRAAPFDPTTDTGTPRVILLTPGRFNETYFEQAYLARYLGIPLVEGSDLTVRGQRLYLKTLHGLERVHAVIRRIDDSFCDPLELNPVSALGVPGLLQAVRAGQVLVANSIGSAILESPALQGFLPAIARHFLGEDLLLAPRDSWWCGETVVREQAYSSLNDVRVRATHRGQTPMPRGTEGAGLLNIQSVRDWVDADPEAYTIQSYLPYSKSPCWHGQAIVPRSSVVRFYAVHLGDDGWHVMPGGLTRLADRQDEVSMQRGGSSTDTWVTTGAPPDEFSMLSRSSDLPIWSGRRRVVGSRAAENLFWMGRYTERMENTIRMAQAILRIEPDDAVAEQSVIRALIRSAIGLGLLPEDHPIGPQCSLDPAGPIMPLGQLQALVVKHLADPRSCGLRLSANGLIHCANQIRDRLSVEHWQQLAQANDIFSPVLEDDQCLNADDVQQRLQTLATAMAVVTAAQTDGMTRDDGWRLLMAGRQIERLHNLCLWLDAFFQTGAVRHHRGFQGLLDFFRSGVTYRARFQGQERLIPLLDLLVHDTENPRSLACVLGVVARELAALESSTGHVFDLVIDVSGIGTVLIRDADREPTLDDVLAVAERTRQLAAQLSDRISARFFTHTQDADRQVLTS